MIPIINEKYDTVFPQAPSHRAIAVFNKKDAHMAFCYGNCDFVIALDDKTGKFAYCRSIAECVEFWGLEPESECKYEMYLKSEPEHLFQFNCWVPITDEYLKENLIDIEARLNSGLLRIKQK
jgi:hypothetical protein